VSRRRLDEEIAARGLLPSRARARDAVLRGTVSVNGVLARKPSQSVEADDSIIVADKAQHYVSRAALKLLHALERFSIPVQGRICLDIGASTGGFTQVLLENGAKHVTAIDVGHGQLVPHLAKDNRVTPVEGLNVRDITRDQYPQGCSLITCDVSFISLKLALPSVLALVSPGTDLIALIKPQFEAGKEKVGKGGVVSDPALHKMICDDIGDFLEASGWEAVGVAPSPIEGGDGNREFLIAARKL
jgi:23S rRNA (cytidine1920-2'-O)/16S rRNA (cytidine1409-2'-O)-methyltransferase